MSFIKKYEPKAYKDIRGQEQALVQLKAYVQGFKKGKAALLYGPTGCGKTSAVHALAKELNYEILEINASDARNKASIQSLLGAAVKQQSLFFRGKIVLVDEIDGLSGKKDRGCLGEVSSLLGESAFPVVCTALDPSDKKFKAIRKASQLIEFAPVDHKDVTLILKHICEQENISFDESVLNTISRMSGGDVRAAINDLQVVSATLGQEKTLTKEHLSTLGERESKTAIQEALLQVFKTTDPHIALSAFNHLDIPFDKALLWIDENMPYEYEKVGDRARAADFISRADIMQRRIRRWQHWRFLVYIHAFLSGGIAVSKDEKYKKMIEYKQTRRLLKIWQANMKHVKRKSICEKIAGRTHTSSKRVFKDVFPFVHAMFQNNKEIGERLAEEFELEQEEVAWLMKKA